MFGFLFNNVLVLFNMSNPLIQSQEFEDIMGMGKLFQVLFSCFCLGKIETFQHVTMEICY